MKTTLTFGDFPKQDYPKLMQSKDEMIVLFTEENEGTVLHQGKDCYHELGRFSETWAMEGFKDFYGTLELTN